MLQKRNGVLMKMKKIDIIIMVAFVAALFILSFFWACRYDPIITAIGLIILLVSALATIVQFKKIKELEELDEISAEDLPDLKK